tara:strand:+ start:108 stop:368 length:261 start_codon:yes stop_codon:yes gene_type:complete
MVMTISGIIMAAIKRVMKSITPMVGMILIRASIMLFSWGLVVYGHNSILVETEIDRSKIQTNSQSGFLGWRFPVTFPIAIASWFEH